MDKTPEQIAAGLDVGERQLALLIVQKGPQPFHRHKRASQGLFSKGLVFGCAKPSARPPHKARSLMCAFPALKAVAAILQAQENTNALPD